MTRIEEHIANVRSRPTDSLRRAMQANREAACYRNPETGRRHFAHLPEFRPWFVREILTIREELRNRYVGER